MPPPSHLQIDQLKLSLPPGWQGHAPLFARYLANLLGQLEIRADVRVDHLSIPPVTARAGENYQVVARRVARQIEGQLRSLPAAEAAAPAPTILPFPSQPNAPHA